MALIIDKIKLNRSGHQFTELYHKTYPNNFDHSHYNCDLGVVLAGN